MSRNSRLVVSLLAGAACAFSTVAAAQEAQRGVGVADRDRPDYDPIGIRAGGFIIYPAVTGSVEYTDNLFKQPSNEQDDTVFAISPEVLVESQWSRHALNFEAGLTTNAHDENDNDDVTDYNVGLDGRIDVTRDTFAVANVGYSVFHEDRGSPDLPSAAAEPSEVSEFVAGASLTHRFNRLAVTPGVSFTQTDYDDVALLPPLGGTLNNDDRDRDELVGSLRAAYEVSPAFQVFAEGRYREIEYDNFDDNLGGGGVARRDSQGFDALAGTTFDLGALARGSLAVGYTEQDYDSALIKTVDGLIYEAGVEWFVTELTTVNVAGARSVEETTINNAAGYLASSLAVGVDHELRRNILVGADVSYVNSDYEGVNRSDDVYGVGVDGTYLLNRNFSLNLGYDFEARESNAAASDYDVNSVILSLRAAL